jgi:hypothetical protein
MKLAAIFFCSPAALTLLCGCGAVHFPAEVEAANLTDVNQIRNNANLTGQQKRDELSALGFDEVTINGLLRGDRTANQFGGTQNTAFDKVTGDVLLTLTPDEIQLYGDLTNATVFSDAQAQELSQLFIDNLIATVDELETWLTDNDIDSAAGLTDENVQAVFIDTDPDTLIPNLP